MFFGCELGGHTKSLAGLDATRTALDLLARGKRTESRVLLTGH